MSERPWFADGLRFACTQCGNCCGGAPGYVWISDQEIVALADRLGMDDEAFRRRYCMRVGKRGISLKDLGRKQDYRCVFFDPARGCTVYEDRPRQCRTWPFWRCVTADEESWREEAAECPGMDQGPLHDAAAIAAVRADDGLP
jgi:Fe-S-cluster containining protein